MKFEEQPKQKVKTITSEYFGHPQIESGLLHKYLRNMKSFTEVGWSWKGFVGGFHLYGYIAVRAETLSAPRGRNPWSNSGPLEASANFSKTF